MSAGEPDVLMSPRRSAGRRRSAVWWAGRPPGSRGDAPDGVRDAGGGSWLGEAEGGERDPRHSDDYPVSLLTNLGHGARLSP